jgi:tight adherence protein C
MDLTGIIFYSTLLMAAGSLVMAVYWLVARPVNLVEERLRAINPNLDSGEAPVLTEPVTTAVFEKAARRLSEKLPSSPRTTRRLRRRLMRAGYYNDSAPAIFNAIRLVSAITLPVLMFFLLTGVFRQPVTFAVMGLTLTWAGFGIFLPSFTLSRMIANRQHRIRRALPDALDLMVVCVEAGLGLNAAFNRVGQEMDLVEPALAYELAITNREIRAGKAREEALRNLGDRTGVEDLKSLVAMLVQTDRFGTSIAESLRVFADSMRIKRRQRAEEQVAKAAVKLLFPLLFFIFPALLIVLMGPALIKIYDLFFFMSQQP